MLALLKTYNPPSPSPSGLMSPMRLPLPLDPPFGLPSPTPELKAKQSMVRMAFMTASFFHHQRAMLIQTVLGL